MGQNKLECFSPTIFQVSLIFAGKGGAYSSGPPLACHKILAIHKNFAFYKHSSLFYTTVGDDDSEVF